MRGSAELRSVQLVAGQGDWRDAAPDRTGDLAFIDDLAEDARRRNDQLALRDAEASAQARAAADDHADAAVTAAAVNSR